MSETEESDDIKMLAVRWASSIGAASATYGILRGAMWFKKFGTADFLAQCEDYRAADMVVELPWVHWQFIPVVFAIIGGILAMIWVKHSLEPWWCKALFILPVAYLAFLVNVLLA